MNIGKRLGPHNMTIASPADQPLRQELDLLRELLPLDQARVLELGCGTAQKTQEIVEHFTLANMTAAEVDPAALAANLARTDLTQIKFTDYAAQHIPEPDEQFDIVLMFKSLHHVPVHELQPALVEIFRVLKPGGLLYISEPVFAGEFNEVLRIFHDESVVRTAAFEAIQTAVNDGLLHLVAETFFKNLVKFRDFDQFKRQLIDATHTQHHLSAAQLIAVQQKFESYVSARGYVFEVPNRVDLLRKPA